MTNKILLLDSHSLINRAFYALPPLSNNDGVFTNAITGYLMMLNRLIVEENGYLNLKGKAKPVLTYNVIGIKEGNNEETVNDSKD